MNTMSREERIWALVFAIALGLTLSVGVLPSTLRIFQWIAPLFPADRPLFNRLLEKLFFPFLCWGLWMSLPQRSFRKPPSNERAHLLKTIPLAFIISMLYGALQSPRAGGLVSLESLLQKPETLLWYILFTSLGEEWLFRGWVYDVAEWLWRDKFFTLTNPLPTSIWVSSIAFSLWHLQNISLDPMGLVVFQMFYTFFTGIWLGYLKWQSGGLTLPIFSHISINLAVNLF